MSWASSNPRFLIERYRCFRPKWWQNGDVWWQLVTTCGDKMVTFDDWFRKWWRNGDQKWWQFGDSGFWNSIALKCMHDNGSEWLYKFWWFYLKKYLTMGNRRQILPIAHTWNSYVVPFLTKFLITTNQIPVISATQFWWLVIPLAGLERSM